MMICSSSSFPATTMITTTKTITALLRRRTRTNLHHGGISFRIAHHQRKSFTQTFHSASAQALPGTVERNDDAAYAAAITEETSNQKNDTNATITILGFGSLLSETSARLTFPNLTDFRLVRVPHYRRVFCHPASIFFQRGIADLATLQISSLSVEYVNDAFPGFVGVAFSVLNDGWMQQDNHNNNVVNIPTRAFLEREEEFDIRMVPYLPLDNENDDDNAAARQQQQQQPPPPTGIICARSTDEEYIRRWGRAHFEQQYQRYGVNTIWSWDERSGIRPCAVYLRHCYLAAQNMGPTCFNSFLDETFLVDRVTTVREYLQKHPAVLDQLPPPELLQRYNG